MGRGLWAVVAVIGAIGLALLSGGIAVTARSGPPVGLVVAGVGSTMVVLAAILIRIRRRAATSSDTLSDDELYVSPALEMPFWTPRHVPLRNGDGTPRSATWALLESMRADAINEAAKEPAAGQEAARHAPRPGSIPPV